ncbi:MAG TPA: GNAT family N-acetyltransferase [Solirubrobacterales bacterium]|nr:GNAT family N-acetyltransferase [Solirubrobacterales bacterium]
MAGTSVAIKRVGSERIEELGPPYVALHEHHAAIRPRLAGAPARDAADSWRRRRRRYEGWLTQPGAFALLARPAGGGSALGFAVVTVEDAYDSWDCGERIGDVHDLAVLPEARGAGLGGELLARVASELAADGVSHYRLLVLDGNDDAVRFYERAGMTAVVQQMLGPTQS